MKKFETLEDLAKAATSLAGTLVKNADFHKAAAGHHAAHAAHHGEMAAFHKGLHDALDDGHEDKAYHKKMSDHHDVTKAHHGAMHELHKGYAADAEKLAGVFDLQKAAAPGTPAPAPATPAPKGVDGVFDATINKILEKTMSTIEDSPAVAAAIEKAILAKFNERFGNVTAPDGVRVVAPQPPEDVLSHLRLVPRAGSSQSLEKATVDPGMEEAFAI